MIDAATERNLMETPDAVLNLSGQHVGWISQLRTKALKHFNSNGFPSLRDEDWRYTNLAAIEKKQFVQHPKKLNRSQVKEWLESRQLAEAWTVVVVDGFFCEESSTLDGLDSDVTVVSMEKVLNQHPELVESYLGKAVNYNEHSLVALNTAAFADGVFISIPQNVVLEKPLQILNIVTEPGHQITVRNLVVVEENARFQLVETFAGVEQAYFSLVVNEVFLGERSEIVFHKFQTESVNAFHFGGTYVKQARESHFAHHNFAFGGLLARNDVHADLDKAAECQLNGLYLGVKRQHIDNHTRINHLKPEGISREYYKGVLDDRARGVFQGRVTVAPDAQKTDSEMSNRNLLLSEDAEADTKPQLEIYADDVKCGHGVTVGQLDEKSIFYLQSRGVDEETARNMLTFAFANEMVDKIKIKSLHDQILESLLTRFPQGGVDKEWL